MNETKIISVVGCGHVGSTLVSLLLSQREPFVVNVMDPEPDVYGNLLDLSHMAALEKRHRLTINDRDLFISSDFVFHAAGTRVVHGEDRRTTAADTISITRSIFEGTKFRNDPYVIVIANPVDAISFATWYYSNVPADKVIGTGTMIDTIRMEYYLSDLMDQDVRTIKACIIGEHGKAMVPLYEHTSIDRQPLTSRQVYDRAVELTANAAHDIRNTKVATTFGVAECAMHIMHSILRPHSEALTICVQLNDHYTNMLGCDPIFMSVPAKISRQGVKPILDFGFTEHDLNELRTAANEITAVIKENNLATAGKAIAS